MLGRRHRPGLLLRHLLHGANSYYFDSHGDAPFRPATTPEVAWRSAHFDLDDYSFAAAPSSTP